MRRSGDPSRSRGERSAPARAARWLTSRWPSRIRWQCPDGEAASTALNIAAVRPAIMLG